MADLRLLDPGLRPWAVWIHDLARYWGLGPVITSTLRSRSDQERLYRRYQQGLSRFPAAPPGTSLHERGLAFDMDLDDERYLEDLGRFWESFGPGFKWGGRGDPVHFAYRPPQ